MRETSTSRSTEADAGDRPARHRGWRERTRGGLGGVQERRIRGKHRCDPRGRDDGRVERRANEASGQDRSDRSRDRRTRPRRAPPSRRGFPSLLGPAALFVNPGDRDFRVEAGHSAQLGVVVAKRLVHPSGGCRAHRSSCDTSGFPGWPRRPWPAVGDEASEFALGLGHRGPPSLRSGHESAAWASSRRLVTTRSTDALLLWFDAIRLHAGIFRRTGFARHRKCGMTKGQRLIPRREQFRLGLSPPYATRQRQPNDATATKS